MSLADAKELIQRDARWFWSDGAGDHTQFAFEFTPERIEWFSYAADGHRARIQGCRYEDYEPYVQNIDNWTVMQGVHKGEHCVNAGSGPYKASCNLGLGVPTLEEARQLAAALLRWKRARPEERSAWGEAGKARFAAVLQQYQSANPKPDLPEEARRVSGPRRVIHRGRPS
jgi:hypothetical protein